MTHFEVDPDSLTAAGEVARRQADHVEATASYIGSVCSRFDAFSGVLSLFLGNYQETVETAQQGMTDSRRVADKVERCFTQSREAYLDSDLAAHKIFEKLFGDEMALPPYVAPGSGSTAPGGPYAPAGQQPADGEETDPFSLPGLPPYVDKPLNRVIPGDPSTLPPWMDPGQAAKDGLLETIRDERTRDAYRDYREEGMTPAEALSHARRNPDSVADGHNYDRMMANQQQAYDNAYDGAIADGRTPDEARTAGNDAASAQHSGDARDHTNRQDILNGAGTYKGGYDEVRNTIDNVNDLVEGAQQLDETVHDTQDYNDYENQPEDESAQEWAR